MGNKRIEDIEKFVSSLRMILNIPNRITSTYQLEELIDQLNGKISVVEKSPTTVSKNGDSFHIQVKEDTVEEIANGLSILFVFMGYLIDEDLWAKSSVYIDSAYNISNITYNHFLSQYFINSLICTEKEFILLSKKYLENNLYDVDKISNELQLSSKYIIVYLRNLSLI